MSIIEKALDKSEEKGEPRRKPVRPDEPRHETETPPPRRAKQARPTRGSAAAEKQTPLPPLEDEPLAPPRTEPAAARRNRPDFPRQTVKKIVLDIPRLNTAGIITPESQRIALVEQFRTIKRPILMKASRSSDNRVPNGNLVLVTSAIPGEGKTFTAVNLAMSIAMELDHSVLLIDADVIKSDVSHLLGIDESEGLTDFLAQPERALSEFLVKTDISSLTVLPAGHPRANVTELLASDQMRQLVEDFGRRYTDRVVIIDSPPLLATSGASVLSHLVGQTVFVVEAVRTPQSAIEEALGVLNGVRNVGIVLNKSRDKDGLGHQYGSYYAPRQ